MKVKFLGHSSFLIESGKYSVLTDPFLSGNPYAAVRPKDVKATHILVSHGHRDHLGDASEIAKRCRAEVFCCVENEKLFEKGVRLRLGQPGGSIATGFGKVKFTSAIHGNGGPGLACGFVIYMEGKKIYFAGDTALSYDMALLKDEHIDLALLPIGDYYTMGPEDAFRAAEMISPKTVIPMHYDTFPEIRQDPLAFQRMMKEKGFDCRVLKPGESMEL